jgi:hypothetical protein
MFYKVAGWSASLGTTFNPAWLTGNPNGPFTGYGLFGLSAVASGVAGGGSMPAPPFPLFGGTGLPGFNLLPTFLTVPTVPIPDMSIIHQGDGIVLSWTIPSANFVLQQNTNLATTAWTEVTATATLDYASLQYELALPRPDGNVFYRLALSGQTNVYGSNIVGYATVALTPGYNLLANPLNACVTNGANEIMPILDGELVLTWNGGSFSEIQYDSTAGGWVSADDVTPASPPSLPPGKGFFFFNPNRTATNFAFMGKVVPGPGTTNCMVLNPGYSLIGSSLPGAINQITSAPVSLPIIDGMYIFQWNGSTYEITIYDSTAGGWVQADDTTPSFAPPYVIGQGFFLFNSHVTANVWCQTLP